MLKGERFSVEVKHFLFFLLKMIICKTIATSSFIKTIENDKVVKRTFLRLETPAPYFYFSHI